MSTATTEDAKPDPHAGSTLPIAVLCHGEVRVTFHQPWMKKIVG